MRDLYFDKQGNPLTLGEFAALFEDFEYRKIDRTEVCPGIEVSTVWLGIDHAFFGGPPLIFETMVFVDYDEPITVMGRTVESEGTEMYRWPTVEAARAGHEGIVTELRNQIDPPPPSFFFAGAGA